MAVYTVLIRRKWFGEELEQKLAEYDHQPRPEELLALAKQHHLGGGATLHVRAKGRNAGADYRVRDLEAANP